MTEKYLAAIGREYPLTEIPAGEFAQVRANGMTFHIRCFRAQGLGWLSVTRAKGFFGLMQMDILILNPTGRDMPLLSYDRVHAMGNDTLIFELYDTTLEKAALPCTAAAKAEGSSLPDHDLGSHWYDSIKLPESLSKKGKKHHRIPFDMLTDRYLEGFLRDCGAAPACDPEKKRERANAYVEGLLTQGGPSTDVFKKALGEEKTARLYRQVLFGTHV